MNLRKEMAEPTQELVSARVGGFPPPSCLSWPEPILHHGPGSSARWGLLRVAESWPGPQKEPASMCGSPGEGDSSQLAQSLNCFSAGSSKV